MGRLSVKILYGLIREDLGFHLFCVVLVDLGLGLGLIGAISLVRPLRILKVPTRRHALVVLAAGIVIVLVGMSLPAPETSVEAQGTALDRFVPVWQFSEHHEISVAAPADRTFEAILAVTAREIALFRTLTAIRRFGRPGPESILNAPADRPLLEVATRTSFLELAREPGHEVVIGTMVIAPSDPPGDPTPAWFDSVSEPGYAKAAMNFVVEPVAGGTRVVTETRVFATDSATRRRFTAYWRTIYPGSALIRRMWLRAIRTRAEAP